MLLLESLTMLCSNCILVAFVVSQTFLGSSWTEDLVANPIARASLADGNRNVLEPTTLLFRSLAIDMVLYYLHAQY